MKSIAGALLVIAGIVVLGAVTVGLTALGIYNGLVNSEQDVNSTWSQVQNNYQRRFDLVPNLVATVKGAAKFEQDTLTKVTEARASVGKLQINASQAPATAEELQKIQQAQGQLGSALSRLLVVSENYPELKATQNFASLQAQLEGTENRIAVARRDFSIAVREYNSKVGRFPGSIMAGMFGFKVRPYFESQAGAEQAVKVEF